MDTIERFEKALVELYGRDIENAVDFCTEEAIDIFGTSPTLDELFAVWGSICRRELARKYSE